MSIIYACNFKWMHFTCLGLLYVHRCCLFPFLKWVLKITNYITYYQVYYLRKHNAAQKWCRGLLQELSALFLISIAETAILNKCWLQIFWVGMYPRFDCIKFCCQRLYQLQITYNGMCFVFNLNGMLLACYILYTKANIMWSILFYPERSQIRLTLHLNYYMLIDAPFMLLQFRNRSGVIDLMLIFFIVLDFVINFFFAANNKSIV